MPSYDFSDQVVLVTGAARGMGRSHAVKFAEHGADIVALDLYEDTDNLETHRANSDDLDEMLSSVEETGADVLPVKTDVTDESDVEEAIEAAIDEFGRIDVLVNNAGIGDFGLLTEVSEEEWDAVLDVNLKGVWLCSKHVGKYFMERNEGGKIVSTSSTTGIVGQHGMGHYSASKHGVIGLTKSLALELAEYDVNVNCVLPTGTNTPGVEETSRVYGSEYVEKAAELSGPWNIFGTGAIEPEQVSEAFLWLASDAARYVTGAALPVDAGFTIK
uniref:Mycofactocin-coupled SDR family oxidoreductase n=1 Tax=Natrinema halophilum TaxID=1699371 RepID=A0A7D5KYQ6_9EURY